MSAWWGELWVIPDVEDHWELAWKVSTSFEEIPGLRQEKWLLCPTSPKVYWKGSVPATTGPMNGQSGFSPRATQAHLGISQGTSLLGRKGEAIIPWLTLPTCRKCTGVKAGYGATHHLPWFQGPWQWHHSMWPGSLPHHLSPPEGVFFSGPWWKTTRA